MCRRCVLTVASEMNRRAAAPRFVSPWAISVRTSQLALAERVLRGRAQLADEPRGDRRREDGLVAGRGPDRADELLARRVLEEVAGRPGLERRHHVAVRVVGREHEHAGLGALLGELPDGGGAAHARHPEVHQDDVRPQRCRRGPAPRRRPPPRRRPRGPGRRRASRAGRRGRPGGRRRSAAGWDSRRGDHRRAGRRSPGRGPRRPSRRPAPIRSRASRRRGPPAGASRSARTRPRPRTRARRRGSPSRRRGRRASRRRPCTTGSARRATAPAWRATFASASWAIRRSATSISGWSATTSPVTATATGTALISDHSRATSASASGSVPASSAAGIDASTERRASVRLSRASRSALSRCRSRSVRPVARLVRRLELGDDPDQALGDGVVDLARHALPLVEHARLAGLGQQLRVQAGVLDRRRLQPRERLAALLVLLGDLLADEHARADDDRLDADDRDVEGPRLGRLRQARR